MIDDAALSGSAGIKVLADKFVLFDGGEGGNLLRCLQMDTRTEFVCKVRESKFGLEMTSRDKREKKFFLCGLEVVFSFEGDVESVRVRRCT